MSKNVYACLIACLFVIILSCNKETERSSLPVSSSSSVRLSQPMVKYFIGENFGGGIIYYIDKSGKHGLIAAPADLEEPAFWSIKNTLNGAKDTALGAGASNSVNIYNTQGYPQFEVDTYAALECLEFTLNGYEDWYLPSLGELNIMFQNKTFIGGFQPFAYWSSSESNATKAWFVNFGSGLQVLQLKTASCALRAVRKF